MAYPPPHKQGTPIYSEQDNLEQAVGWCRALVHNRFLLTCEGCTKEIPDMQHQVVKCLLGPQ
jgi:hypothetical protein